MDAGGQFLLLCRQLGLGKKNKTGIFVRSVDGSQGFGVRTRDRRIPTSKERLRVHLLENHGRKIPTKGETLAISDPSEGEGASQDYKPQDKQTSQWGPLC